MRLGVFVMSALRARVADAMIEGATLAQAEELIASFDLDDKEREAALWLYAWSSPAASDR